MLALPIQEFSGYISVWVFGLYWVFFINCYFFFIQLGFVPNSLMLKVLWDPSSFEGSHEKYCIECFIKLGTIVQGIVY